MCVSTEHCPKYTLHLSLTTDETDSLISHVTSAVSYFGLDSFPFSPLTHVYMNVCKCGLPNVVLH